MPWLTAEQQRSIMRGGPKCYTATFLGQQLELTDEERNRFKAWSILPIDKTWEEIQERKKERNRMGEQKRRRAKGCKSRDEYLAQSYSRTQPWLAFGIGRRAWEKRGKPNPPEAWESPVRKSVGGIDSSLTSIHGLANEQLANVLPLKLKLVWSTPYIIDITDQWDWSVAA
jgi:hypothetical protein